jgi:iron complex outermembrane receptor protein
LTETFEDFLPRVILRYMPTATTNLYAQYSEGQLAGDFNTFFINADARERAQYLALDPRISESLDAETLDAWEIGWKQGFAEGRGQMNLSAYYYTWENIKGRSTFTIWETCDASDMGVDVACNPANGLQAGDPRQIISPVTGELQPLYNSRSLLLPGDATIKGLELETWYFFTENLQWTLNASYINSKYNDYVFNSVRLIAGFSQMAGNQTPRQPKWSGNTSLSYFFNMFDQPAYVRGDWIYQGKSYVDESNLAYISSYNLVNARIGLDMESWLLELFVTNLFDEEAWATGGRWSDFASPTQFPFLTLKQGVAVSPLDKREFGARVSWRF